MALVLAQRGLTDEAILLLRKGEPLIRVYPLEHAKFLCKKGHVFHLAGDFVEARLALQHAETMAQELSSTRESELGQAIAKLEGLLSDTPTSV